MFLALDEFLRFISLCVALKSIRLDLPMTISTQFYHGISCLIFKFTDILNGETAN